MGSHIRCACGEGLARHPRLAEAGRRAGEQSQQAHDEGQVWQGSAGGAWHGAGSKAVGTRCAVPGHPSGCLIFWIDGTVYTRILGAGDIAPMGSVCSGSLGLECSLEFKWKWGFVTLPLCLSLCRAVARAAAALSRPCLAVAVDGSSCSFQLGAKRQWPWHFVTVGHYSCSEFGGSLARAALPRSLSSLVKSCRELCCGASESSNRRGP